MKPQTGRISGSEKMDDNTPDAKGSPSPERHPDGESEPQSGVQVKTAMSVIDWAAKTITAAGWLRPALALVVVAGISVVLLPSIKLATFWILALFVVMVLFYAFSRLVARRGRQDQFAATVLLWVSVAVFVAAIVLLTSLVTARRPTFLADLLQLPQKNLAMIIRRVLASGKLPPGMVTNADTYKSPEAMESFIANAAPYYCPNNPTDGDVCNEWTQGVVKQLAQSHTELAANTFAATSALPYRIPASTPLFRDVSCAGLVVNRLDANAPVIGVDISRHDKVDFKALADRGVSFVIIKSTQGTTLTDPTFISNWKAAGEAGLSRGIYHVFTGAFSAQQTANFAAALKGVDIRPCDIGPALDVGDGLIGLSGETPVTATYIDGALAWLTYAHQLTGKTPLVYYGVTTAPQLKAFPDQFKSLSAYPLWYARYAPDPGGVNYTFWQSSDGRSGPALPQLEGMSVEQNRFNGTRDQFLAFLHRS